jgi:hypothetical protein
MLVTCTGVLSVCRRAPVVAFQTWIAASFVTPPPDASSDGCHRHHATPCAHRSASAGRTLSGRAPHFHGDGVVPLRPLRFATRVRADIARTGVPDVHDVVVPAARGQRAVRVPLEPAHVPRDADVAVPNAAVRRGCPARRAHACRPAACACEGRVRGNGRRRLLEGEHALAERDAGSVREAARRRPGTRRTQRDARSRASPRPRRRRAPPSC